MFTNWVWLLEPKRTSTTYMGRHAVAHDCVVERLPLAGVEPENLDVASDSGQKGRQRSVLFGPLALASHLTTASTCVIVVALVEIVVSLNNNNDKKINYHRNEERKCSSNAHQQSE